MGALDGLAVDGRLCGRPSRTNHPIQFPPTYTPASGDEELERLKELIAQVEELCVEYQVEMYCEAQRCQGRIELLSKELQEMKDRRANRNHEQLPVQAGATDCG